MIVVDEVKTNGIYDENCRLYYDQFEVVLPATLRAAKCCEDLESNTGTIVSKARANLLMANSQNVS